MTFDIRNAKPVSSGSSTFDIANAAKINQKGNIPAPENILQRAASIAGRAVQEAVTPQSANFNPQNPFLSALGTTTGFENVPGLGALQSAERARGSVIEDAAGPGLGGMALNIASDPLTYLGGGASAKVAKEGIPKVGAAIGKRVGNAIPITRAPEVFGKRAEDIASRAAQEEGALKGYQGFRTGQIQEEGNALISAAEKKLASQGGPSTEAITGLQNEIAKSTQQAAVLEGKVPDVAYQSGKAATGRIRQWITKEGKSWGQGLARLIGKGETDIMLDPKRVSEALTKTLESSGVYLQEGEKGLQALGQIGPEETKILNVLNDIRSSGKPYGIKQLLKDKNMFGSRVSFGKQWDRGDWILNKAQHNISKIAEDVVPGLKQHNSKWAQFADLRDTAVKKFDVFGGEYSKSGRPFIESLAKGGQPEERALAQALESKIGDFSTPAKQVWAGSKEHLAKVDNLKSQITNLEKSSQAGKVASEAELAATKASIKQTVESEIKRLEELTTQDIVKLQNRTGESVAKLTAMRDKAAKKLAKLKAVSVVGGSSIGAAGLLTGGKQILSILQN